MYRLIPLLIGVLRLFNLQPRECFRHVKGSPGPMHPVLRFLHLIKTPLPGATSGVLPAIGVRKSLSLVILSSSPLG